MPKIFDPYFSTKEMGCQKGMGLGLSLCHSIIKRHHGHIHAESTQGEGT
ncbi:MAG: ATP-binding protein [Desulfuromonadaceae bacterium]|nr:ATP-binding protein [Desulfuromonadaceae bacterium]